VRTRRHWPIATPPLPPFLLFETVLSYGARFRLMTRDAMFDPDGPQSAFRRLRRCRAAAAAAAASAAAGFFITTPGATVLCRNSN